MNKGRVIECLENIFHADYDGFGRLTNDTFDIEIPVIVSQKGNYVNFHRGAVQPGISEAEAFRVIKEAILDATRDSTSPQCLSYPYNCNIGYIKPLLDALASEDAFSSRRNASAPANSSQGHRQVAYKKVNSSDDDGKVWLSDLEQDWVEMGYPVEAVREWLYSPAGYGGYEGDELSPGEDEYQLRHDFERWYVNYYDASSACNSSKGNVLCRGVWK